MGPRPEGPSENIWGHPESKMIKAKLVAGGYENHAERAPVNSAMKAHRSSTAVLLSWAALRKWGVLRINISTALLKSSDSSRRVLPAPSAEAGVSQGKLRRARRANYGLANGPGAFYRTLDDSLRKGEVWEPQVGSSSVQAAIDTCERRIAMAPETGDSYLASDRRGRLWGQGRRPNAHSCG